MQTLFNNVSVGVLFSPLVRIGKASLIVTFSLSRFFSNAYHQQKSTLQECCSILGVEINCSDNELRAAYLNKVKVHHPDRQKDKTDSSVFNQIHSAYQKLLDHRKDCSARHSNDGEKFDLQTEDDEEEEIIRHTAPQHRQYLSFEGIGVGTHGQRRRQYQQFQVARANERIYEHRKMKFGMNESAVISKDKAHARKIKTSNLIHRLVDDMVRESMQKGDFDNLPGKGRPLDYSNHNPLLDATTHNLNKILVNNGFMPEWILLSKEIRSEIAEARQKLAIIREQLGAPPYSEEDEIRWCFHKDKFKSSVADVNKKINKFNFIVPFMEKQMVHYNVESNTEKVIMNHRDYLPTDEEGQPMVASQLPPFPHKQVADDKIDWKEVWSNIKEVFRQNR